MSRLSELMKRKVLGVPMLYLVGAFVAILALVAWKMQQTPPEADTPVDPEADQEQDGAPPLAGGDTSNYDAITGKGTVIVSPTEPITEPTVVETNETWAKKAIEWLVQSNKASAGAAQTAISKYLAGSQLSYSEGALRDAAVKEKGLPPDTVTQASPTASQPARKAFTGRSGWHTVKNSNDNTAVKLAMLYYGANTSSTTGLITKANSKIGGGPYAIGTRVFIPDLNPVRYFTTTSKIRSKKAIAAANGIPVSRLEKYNPGLANISPVGKKVRVA